MTRRLPRVLVVLALAAALLPMSAAAVPADTSDTPAAEKTELLRMLNAPSVATQERAVRRIGTYAHTGRYSSRFFRLFVVPLHGLVAQGETEAVRLMAVSALASIGTERAIEGLKNQVKTLKPERVRTVTEFAIAEYEAARPAVSRTLEP